MGIDTTLVTEIAQDTWAVEPRAISEIRGKGIVNDVYVVGLDEATYVVRVSPDGDLDQFQKEAWAMASAQELHIPVPEVIKVGIRSGKVFMALEFIEGKDGAGSTVEPVTLWRTLGIFARRIHTIAATGFGDRMVAPGRFQASWPDYLHYNIQSLSAEDHLLQSGIVTSHQSRLMRERFEWLAGEKLSFGLCHGDLSLKNVIVDKTGFATLLDWGSAESHIVPFFDMVEVLQSSFALDDTHAGFLAFAEGLGLDHEQVVDQLPTIQSLLLLRAIDKVRWAFDRKPEKAPLLIAKLQQAMIWSFR